MNTFNLLGDICADDGDRYVQSDVVPAMIIGWLAKQDGDIAININSCGGSVTGGLAIANAIKGYTKGKTTCNILGIAASMASVVACACDEIKMGQGAFMMVHNPFSIALGDAETLRKEADTLDTIKASLMSFYQSKFAKTPEEIAALMDAETWIPFEEAEQYGLACSAYAPEEGDGYKAAAHCDTRLAFARVPEAAKAYYAHIEKPTHAGEVLQPAAEYAVPEAPAQEAPAEAAEAPATPAAEAPTEEPASAPEAAGEPHEEATAEATATPAEEAPKAAAQSCDWEARYKGLQAAKDKELAALRKELADAQNALATAAETARAESATTIEQLNSNLTEKAAALASAQDECKQLRTMLADAKKDLEETQAALKASEDRYRDHVGAALAPPTAGGSEAASNWRNAYNAMRREQNSIKKGK